MDNLETLARHTHSPRGKFAATDDTYRQLLNRIPMEHRPVAVRPKQTGFHFRRSAAASILLAVGIGVAIAGIVYLHYQASSATIPDIVDSKAADIEEIRTLIYEDTPLSTIVSELEKTYHVSIEILDKSLMDYRLTATFSSDEPLAEILSILAEAGGFEVQDTADGFVIK